MNTTVRLEPWNEHGLTVLHASNTPEMTQYIGGPETEEQVAKRHQRHLAAPDTGAMFLVIEQATEAIAGSIGYWHKKWRDEDVFETGWATMPEFQGRGLAAAAAIAVLDAAATGKFRFMHAFPSVANQASNGICRRVGFTLLGESDFEYPPATSCGATTGDSICVRRRCAGAIRHLNGCAPSHALIRLLSLDLARRNARSAGRVQPSASRPPARSISQDQMT